VKLKSYCPRKKRIEEGQNLIIKGHLKGWVHVERSLEGE